MTDLTCLPNETSVVLIWHSTERYHNFAISYSAAHGCNVIASSSSVTNRSVSTNFIIVHNLQSLTYYHFTVKPIVAGIALDGEEGSVLCKTLSKGKIGEHKLVIKVIFFFLPAQLWLTNMLKILVAALGACVIVCVTLAISVAVSKK